MNSNLTEHLDLLSPFLRRGFQDASAALSKWLDRRIAVVLEQVKLFQLESAIETLGPADEVQCACCLRFTGGFSGQLALTCDDASGLKLSDILFQREYASVEWGELEISALLETTNILGCSLLNSLALASQAVEFTGSWIASDVDTVWMPTAPPVFVRDFAGAIMESILVNQGSTLESLIIAKTKWEVESDETDLQLLLLPDGVSFKGDARIAN
jgi:chemotaxis protein CheC